MELLQKKNRKLQRILSEMGKVLIAFSGGVDSTLVMKLAKQTLGTNILAITAASETFPDREFQSALALAKTLGVRLLKTEIKEFENPHFVRNPTDRCYHCKTGLYQHLREIALELDYPYVLDGTNMDDLGDYRPGIQAKSEQGVRSPLQEAGFYKKEIRELSKQLGLPNWNKPSFACLSSRVPYGEKITARKIDQIDRGEIFLIDLGFQQVRVRHHEKIARIEVPIEDFPLLLRQREVILQHFRTIGFSYIALDLNGYRTGSMNEVLSPPSSLL